MNDRVWSVTQRIMERSRDRRQEYLGRIEKAAQGCTQAQRHCLPCSNLAHVMAGASSEEKDALAGNGPCIGILTSYSDMLSAHCPYGDYPRIIKEELSRQVDGLGATALVAAGVPAMCDGVTQGLPGMELSLMSRDVIAMSVAIGLCHDAFDGVLLLGVCDKIVPGLLMGALHFGHLPMMLVPAGPMPSGIPNRQKSEARQLYAQGRIGRKEMLEVEAKAYHARGTCTFYGTANSNQLLAEVMGLHLPGASFVPPDTPLREAFTMAAARRVCQMTRFGSTPLALGRLVDERTMVNAMVALLASGGSTNQTMHLVAMAKAAGILLDWNDFSELSDAVPLLARIYPNGPEDINGFQEAGGMAAFIGQLAQGGFLHMDVETVAGQGLEAYTKPPRLQDGQVTYDEPLERPGNEAVIARISAPFSQTGGLRLLEGNLGRAVIKVSALERGEETVVEAEARVFDHQDELIQAFERGELRGDLVAVVRFQGPAANGMPELHKLITPLGVLIDQGFQVALVTDGRLSGASGKVPAAIHLSPEAFSGGLLAKVKDGDRIRLDVPSGSLQLLVDSEVLSDRPLPEVDLSSVHQGMGRELFAPLRAWAEHPEEGGSAIFSFGREAHTLSARMAPPKNGIGMDEGGDR